VTLLPSQFTLSRPEKHTNSEKSRNTKLKTSGQG